MKRKNFERRKEAKREGAKKRQEERDKRTNDQQLEVLDRKLGKGQGARKERARLSKPD